jgi:Tol biopolymer transport system component
VIAGIVASATSPGRRATAAVAARSFEPVTFRRGHVHAARFGLDRSTIIYTASWDGEPPRTFASLVGHPDARPLFEPGVMLQAIAPDGRVALDVGSTTLASATLAGDLPRPLEKDVESADWIPGTDELAVVRAGAVVEFPIGSRVGDFAEQVLGIRVSPDGERVAIVSTDNYTPELLVIDRRGATKSLVRNWRTISGIAWAPDGREIWFSGARREGLRLSSIVAVDLDGSLRTIEDAPISLAIHDISADGRVLISRELDSRTAIGRRPGDTVVRDLSWFDATNVKGISASGDRFLFDEVGLAAPNRAFGALAYVRNLDGSPPMKVHDTSALALSPDGTRVLAYDPRFVATRADPASHEQLLVIPTGTGQTKSLPRGRLAIYESGAFSDDGKQIFVVASEAGERRIRIYVQDLEGGEPRAVTPVGTAFWTPMSPMSPDGAWVFAHDESGGVKLYDVGGGAPREIPGLEQGDKPVRWMSDRRLLVSRRHGEAHRTIYAVDLDSETWQALHVIGPDDPAGVGTYSHLPTLALTPDGRAYVYSYSRRLSQLFVVTGLR